MPHGEYAECPKCGKVAHGEDEIEEEFGYRFGGTSPQSWCRECRRHERIEATCTDTDCPGYGNEDCSSNYDCPRW